MVSSDDRAAWSSIFVRSDGVNACVSEPCRRLPFGHAHHKSKCKRSLDWSCQWCCSWHYSDGCVIGLRRCCCLSGQILQVGMFAFQSLCYLSGFLCRYSFGSFFFLISASKF